MRLIKSIFLSLALSLVSSTTMAANEGWTLTFDSHQTMQQGQVTINIKTQRNAHLSIYSNNTLTGKGTISITETTTG